MCWLFKLFVLYWWTNTDTLLAHGDFKDEENVKAFLFTTV